MEVNYLGHSCFSIHIGGKTLLFDPFITPNPLAKAIDIKSLKADFILISHAHFDHIADALELAQTTQAKIIAIWEICDWLQKQGYSNTHAMNIGGSFAFDFGKVQMVKAEHSSAFPDGSYGGQAAGFVITIPEKTIYFAGDTALCSDMQIIGMKHKIDLAFLPLGSNFTMDVEDAVIASKWIKCQSVIGMHFDTFGYIVIDHEQAQAQFKAADIQLTLMNIGQSIQI